MRSAPPIRRWLTTLALLSLLAVVAVVSYRRAEALKFDFHYFYLDADYVWRHGELNPLLPDLAAGDEFNRSRRQLPFYLPAVPLLLAPLAAGGLRVAAAVWAGLHVLALLASIRVLWRHCGAADPTQDGTRHASSRSAAALVLAVALALPAIYEAALFNQLSFMVLALVLCGVDGVLRGRPLTGGFLLAAATVLKLLPGVFVLWLLLKRQWTALAAFACGVLLIGLIPCLLRFGTERTIEYHREWFAYNLPAVAGGKIDPALREHFIDHHNQSIAAVVARLAWPEHRFAAPFQPLRLSRAACSAVALAIAAVLAAALIWFTRPAAAAHAETAAYLLAMLVFAPLLRQYYMVWVLPALAWFSAAALASDAGRSRAVARAALVVWLVGLVAWLSDTARIYGAHLAMLIVLGAMLIIAAAGLRARLGGADARAESTA